MKRFLKKERFHLFISLILVCTLVFCMVNFFQTPLLADTASCNSGACSCSCDGTDCTCTAQNGSCDCSCEVGEQDACDEDKPGIRLPK